MSAPSFAPFRAFRVPNAPWYEQVAGRSALTLAESLSEEVRNAARTRGAQRDPFESIPKVRQWLEI